MSYQPSPCAMFKLPLTSSLTVHEFRYVDTTARPLRIRVCHHSGIGRRPPKGIGHNHDQSLGSRTLRRLRDVGFQAMELCFLAGDVLAVVDVPCKAVGAGHGGVGADERFPNIQLVAPWSVKLRLNYQMRGELELLCEAGSLDSGLWSRGVCIGRCIATSVFGGRNPSSLSGRIISKHVDC
jgi:hypothetical protein